ncbi:hypothetical protein [Vibrio parahaemolyticus]|uniref:hypothetical protein n=1 Tax=Vibrio parahaemolyticus TaxID=670 RepID=UPI001020ECC8|nr:hypothetical protein [Vibrio parahaemolyticus]
MEQNISNYQSLFQLLTAIYLVAEWVSLEKIGSYYQNKFRDTFRYRLKSNRKYSPLINDIYEEFEDKEWTVHYSRQLSKNYAKFKSICWVFFVLSLGALIYSSFYPAQSISHWIAALVILALLTPFFWVVVALLRPAHKQHKLNVVMFEDVLLEVENAKNDYRIKNPAPTLSEAREEKHKGDKLAYKKYFIAKQKYNAKLIQYMQNKFKESR